MEDFNETIREAIIKKRFDLWRDALSYPERIAEADHTVVRFPNAVSYIFATGSTFWMVDPAYTHKTAGFEEEIKDLGEILCRNTDFVLFTHLHRDHIQPEWIEMLSGSKVKIVISKRFAEDYFKINGADPANTIQLSDDETVALSGIKITARAGYHCEPGKMPVIACAYDVELPDGVKLFFPGDVRDPSAGVPDGAVDYTFGHVFLGRDDATGNDFPLFEDVCRFLTRRKSSNLFLNHLYEIGRLARDLWTHRHAAMIKDRVSVLAPEMNVFAPHFGDAVHLTKGKPIYPDIFQEWTPADRKDFLSNLGISIKKDHAEWMKKAAELQIPVIEWTAHLLYDFTLEELRKQVSDWRRAGGRILSIHLPNFPLKDDPDALDHFNRSVKNACDIKVDRVTIHIPGCTVSEATEDLDGILDRCAEFLKPLLASGIRVGIENMHMKPYFKPDETRPFGFVPEELLAIVNGLRVRCGELVGCHVDIGHAYSNYPYAEKYDLSVWLEMCGRLINGMHLHQFEFATDREHPYLSGHSLISGRNIGHPNLSPLYSAWAQKMVYTPMFLEVYRHPETVPFESIRRLHYLF